MDGGLSDVHVPNEDFTFCQAQDNLFASFVPADLSADSASTTQLASAGGALCYTQCHPYTTSVHGHPISQEFQPAPTADGCGFFDECHGVYSTQPSIHYPYIPSNVSMQPALSRDQGYDDLTETIESATAAANVGGNFIGMPSMCQDSSMMTARCLTTQPNAASSHMIISELDRSLPSDTFHVSKTVPTLSSQPQHMEQPALRCAAGLLEPSLTIGGQPWNIDPIVKEETVSRRPSPQRRSEESLGTGTNASKNRWKPNPRQLYHLEQHFRTGIITDVTAADISERTTTQWSGYTKTTPELFRAVREVGAATELQVSVWLKNRLARYKRHPNKETDPRSEESTTLETDLTDASLTGNKRERMDEDFRDDFGAVRSSVLDELSTILQSVDSRDMMGLARAIRDANRICCYSVSREGLALKAFTISLNNLGFKAFFVGDTNTPPLSAGDLFLVSAGPSYYSTVNALSLEAMRSGARVIAFTAHKTAPLPYVDCVIRIASQTLPPCMPVMNRKLGGMHAEMVSSLPDGRESIMQMGASFEVALSLVLESLCVMLRKKLQISSRDMASRATNIF